MEEPAGGGDDGGAEGDEAYRFEGVDPQLVAGAAMGPGGGDGKGTVATGKVSWIFGAHS